MQSSSVIFPVRFVGVWHNSLSFGSAGPRWVSVRPFLTGFGVRRLVFFFLLDTSRFFLSVLSPPPPVDLAETTFPRLSRLNGQNHPPPPSFRLCQGQSAHSAQSSCCPICPCYGATVSLPFFVLSPPLLFFGVFDLRLFGPFLPFTFGGPCRCVSAIWPVCLTFESLCPAWCRARRIVHAVHFVPCGLFFPFIA